MGKALIATVAVLAFPAIVSAQCLTATAMPVVVYSGPLVAPTPVVSYSPVTVAPVVAAPVVGTQVMAYRPVVTSTPAVVYSPVQAPVVASPVATTVYSPVAVPVTTYRVAAPTVVYSPVVAPVVVGRAPVVSTKVYYPGEPIRNFFKAITP